MKNRIIILLSLTGLLFLNGCSDFLKEESQSEVIPKTTTDFSELLLGSGYPDTSKPNIAFLSLMDDDAELFLTYLKEIDMHVESNEAINYHPTYSWQYNFEDYNGNGTPINENPGSTAYAGFYEKILGCNAILAYIDDALGTQAERDRIKAEALAIRAMYYFWLVNLYGEPYNHNKEALGVPVKKDAGTTEEPIARSSVKYIYEELIVKDLIEATRLMDPLSIVRKDYHINQPAIHILLSRVYLHMEKYQECISEVNKAIAQGAVLLDMVNSLETIQTIGNYGTVSYPPITYTNPEVEWLFGPTPVIETAAYRMGSAPHFREIWDQVNDMRFLSNAFAFSDSDVLMSKPRNSSSFAQSIRTAEAYLNRMEAYALSGSDGDALAELNKFRRLRIAGYTDINASGNTLLEEIRLERRRELCYEGHRWFDLRRYGMPKIEHLYKYEKGGLVYVYTLEQGDPMYTLPFPSSLLARNKALKQNPSASMSARQSVAQ